MYGAGSRCESIDSARQAYHVRGRACIACKPLRLAMASVLTIRKLPDDVQAALRQRAAASGRSVEAEAREIFASACLPRQTAAWWDELAKRRLRGPRNSSASRVPTSFGKVGMRVDEVPGRIVVDASLGLKWVLQEEHSDRAAALGCGREMLTSALFWAEAGNAIATRVRRGELDRVSGNDALRDLQRRRCVPGRSTPMRVGRAGNCA